MSTTVTTTPAGPTTTQGEEEWQLESTSTSAGTIIVRFRTSEVVLDSATPSAGFAVDVKESGPPRVRVEFDDGENEVEYRAEWKEGSLVIDVDEN